MPALITKADIDARAKELGYKLPLTDPRRDVVWANMISERYVTELDENGARQGKAAEDIAAAMGKKP